MTRRPYFNLDDEPAQVGCWPIQLMCHSCDREVSVYVFPPDHLADLYPYRCGDCREAVAA